MISSNEISSENEKTKEDQSNKSNKDENIEEEGEENEFTDDNNKRKRRSKNDTNGRAYKCELCGKSYLSKPAMTQHTKSKHADKLSGDFKKGRGRPRKCDMDDHTKSNQEKYYQIYFNKTYRANITKEEYKINDIYNTSVNSICNSFPCLSKKNGLFELNDLTEEIDNFNQKLPIDKVLILFLKEIKEKTNKDNFSFVCKIIFLLREFLNKERSTDDTIYTKINSCEIIPNISNDFSGVFLDSNNFFELEQFDVLDNFQYFCKWLYENGYSEAVITMLDE